MGKRLQSHLHRPDQRDGLRQRQLAVLKGLGLAAACGAAVLLLGGAVLATAARGPRSVQGTAAVSRTLEVRSVSPPDWWSPTHRHALRLLLTGTGMNGAQVRALPGSFSISDVRTSANGHYLLCTLHWKGTPPSQAGLVVRTPSGASARASFIFHHRRRPPAGFGPDDVIYMAMVDRFAQAGAALGPTERSNPQGYHGGNLAGLEQHLDYLRNLGVTALWLNPTDDNGGFAFHGYHTVNYYRVEGHYGDLGALQQLDAAAHAQGLKVLQDQVLNHAGPHHPWLHDPPEPGWFHGTPANHLAANYEYIRLIDPHASAEMRAPILQGWFADPLPDLNQENPDVAAYEIENSEWWMGRAGIDGVRLDTLPMVSCGFWKQWNQTMATEFPGMRAVGEAFDPNPEVTSYFESRCNAQADTASQPVMTVFDFPLFFALRKGLDQNADLSVITDVLARDADYRHPERLVTFLGNHDVDRLRTSVHGSVARVKLGFGLLLTLRGTPMIYYGDEIGLEGGNDPDNRHDFPGGFPGDTHNAFEASGRTPDQQAIYQYVRSLLALRRQHPALRRGDLEELEVKPHQMVYLRRSGRDAVLVICNTAAKSVTVPLDFPQMRGRHWNAPGGAVLEDGGVVAPPTSVTLLTAAR